MRPLAVVVRGPHFLAETLITPVPPSVHGPWWTRPHPLTQSRVKWGMCTRRVWRVWLSPPETVRKTS